MGFSKFGKLLEGKEGAVSMQLTFSMVDPNTMSIMTAFRKGTEIVGVPLVVTGTYEEINKDFFATMATYQAKIEGFKTNMDSLDAELKAKEAEAKQKIADKAKKTTSGPAKIGSKSVAAPVKKAVEPEKGEEPVGVQRGLFETLSATADAGIAAEAEGGEEGGKGFTEAVETEAEVEA
jgi:PRTRC genetic system protein E